MLHYNFYWLAVRARLFESFHVSPTAPLRFEDEYLRCCITIFRASIQRSFDVINKGFLNLRNNFLKSFMVLYKIPNTLPANTELPPYRSHVSIKLSQRVFNRFLG